MQGAAGQGAVLRGDHHGAATAGVGEGDHVTHQVALDAVVGDDRAGHLGLVTPVGEGHAHDVVAEYQVAVLKGASDPAQAAAFVALLRSEPGQRILQRHGFELP